MACRRGSSRRKGSRGHLSRSEIRAIEVGHMRNATMPGLSFLVSLLVALGVALAEAV